MKNRLAEDRRNFVAHLYSKKITITKDNIDNKDNKDDKDKIKISLLELLLKDQSTGKNIIWATNDYASLGKGFQKTDEITVDALIGDNIDIIRHRVEKTKEEQDDRIKQKGEVFTPSWICNKMNNHCDEEWFGYKYTFNIEDGQHWVVNAEPIKLPEGKTWQSYVNSNRLEITCGEAPYVVSRYDTTSGEQIDINDRIGILDRKLRVVTEKVKKEDLWRSWTYKAFQSVYGFEFQGDNLFLARLNLVETFCDYFKAVWKKEATTQQLAKIVDVITWNFWQMDGLTGTIPFGKKPLEQMNLFAEDSGVDCKIIEWSDGKKKEMVSFSSINKD